MPGTPEFFWKGLVLGCFIAVPAVLLQGCHAMGGPRGPLRVACIGDSITAAMMESGADYPSLLGKELGRRFEVRNFGVSGTTVLKEGDAPYEATPAFGQSLAYGPELVIIMLGTNDSKPGNWVHKGEFVRDLRELVAHFQGLGRRTRVYVALPCPVYGALAGINGDTLENEIIPEIRQVAHDTGAGILDVHAAIKGHPEYLRDGIHPNALGTQAIAGEIYRELKL
jgi:acyl-CoA thioesterase-1